MLNLLIMSACGAVITTCAWNFYLFADSFGVVILKGFLSLEIGFWKHKTCLAKYFQVISLSCINLSLLEFLKLIYCSI